MAALVRRPKPHEDMRLGCCEAKEQESKVIAHDDHPISARQPCRKAAGVLFGSARYQFGLRFLKLIDLTQERFERAAGVGAGPLLEPLQCLFPRSWPIVE
jgi:hypothetical protein